MTHPNRTARVLSLDLATTTGWATLANGVITSGSQDFHKHNGNKTRGADQPGASFLWFDRWLHAKLLEDKPEAICYEEVFRWMSTKAAHAFCGYRGIMLAAAAKANLPVFGLGPLLIKKAWCGTTKADKEAMVKETLRRFPGLDLTDDNEADAIAILHLHLSN